MVKLSITDSDYFIYITDCNEQTAVQKKKETVDLPQNCVVVCNEKLVEIFGKTLSALRQHAIAYDNLDIAKLNNNNKKRSYTAV